MRSIEGAACEWVPRLPLQEVLLKDGWAAVELVGSLANPKPNPPAKWLVL